MAWDAGLPHKTLLQPPNAGTAEPFRVSPPEAVAYPLELFCDSSIRDEMRVMAVPSLDPLCSTVELGIKTSII